MTTLVVGKFHQGQIIFLFPQKLSMPLACLMGLNSSFQSAHQSWGDMNY